MIEARVVKLEKEMEQQKKKNESLYAQVRELQEVVSELVERNTMLAGNDSQEGKVRILTEVNEQMFQQNKRLRQFIEYCIEENVVPTQQEYLKALQG
ncbi:hypothetical protein [Bacillus sp. B15-48]|uniref:hypothetical protein n=1 Tax=Bacillus sp. B15-48 TaxID=1548601 RepID=UPI00193F3C44|nr:hypothetical protein [Bacillus sp. B15-48]MBM4765223.1 hypothetical protein [Bacillus sp. B15-48]